MADSAGGAGVEAVDSPRPGAPSAAAVEDELSVEDSEEGLETDGSNGAADTGGNKKKKKKKKNKKKKQHNEENGEGAGQQHDDHASNKQKPAMTAEEKQEADKRFNKTLNELKSNDEMALWANLNNCNLTDSKLKRLVAALQSNKAVTSIDISDNNITDEGLQMFVGDILVKDLAPELISLNVSRNRLTDVATSILIGLSAIRKNVQVSNVGEKDEEADEEVGPEGDEDLGGDGVDLGKRTRLSDEHFQGPNEDDSGDQLPAQELWDRIQSLLDCCSSPSDGGGAAEASDLSELGWALNQAAECVSDEMANCSTPLLPSTTVAELLPHTRYAAGSVALLGRALDLQPPPRVNQHSHGAEVPAVGIHRVAAANVLAQVLRGRAPSTDRAIESEGLVPKVMKVVLEHPTSSPLQAVGLRILRAAVSSPVKGLWEPLLLVTGSDAQEGEDTLQASIAKVAEAAEEVPVGVRSPLAGFAIAASQLLQAASIGEDVAAAASSSAVPPSSLFERVGEGLGGQKPPGPQDMHPPPSLRPQLSEALGSDEGWGRFVGADGALGRLLASQEQELGGPRPYSYGQDQQDQPMQLDIAALLGQGLVLQK